MIRFVIIFMSFFCSSYSFAQDFVDPIAFKESQRKDVITYIKSNMHKQYCENSILDMCSETVLRMMEEQELKSFKKLIEIDNKPILKKVIKTYCENSVLDMCNYNTLLMMYNQEAKAAQKTLKW